MTVRQNAAPRRPLEGVGSMIARVIRELEAEPGSTVIDLADALGVSKAAVYMALYRAKKAGLPIDAQRSPRGKGGPMCYRLTVRTREIGAVSHRILAAMDSDDEPDRPWTVRELALVVAVEMHAVDQCLRVVLLPRGDVRRVPVRVRVMHGPRWRYLRSSPTAGSATPPEGQP